MITGNAQEPKDKMLVRAAKVFVLESVAQRKRPEAELEVASNVELLFYSHQDGHNQERAHQRNQERAHQRGSTCQMLRWFERGRKRERVTGSVEGC